MNKINFTITTLKITALASVAFLSFTLSTHAQQFSPTCSAGESFKAIQDGNGKFFFDCVNVAQEDTTAVSCGEGEWLDGNNCVETPSGTCNLLESIRGFTADGVACTVNPQGQGISECVEGQTLVSRGDIFVCEYLTISCEVGEVVHFVDDGVEIEGNLQRKPECIDPLLLDSKLKQNTPQTSQFKPNNIFTAFVKLFIPNVSAEHGTLTPVGTVEYVTTLVTTDNGETFREYSWIGKQKVKNLFKKRNYDVQENGKVRVWDVSFFSTAGDVSSYQSNFRTQGEKIFLIVLQNNVSYSIRLYSGLGVYNRTGRRYVDLQGVWSEVPKFEGVISHSQSLYLDQLFSDTGLREEEASDPKKGNLVIENDVHFTPGSTIIVDKLIVPRVEDLEEFVKTGVSGGSSGVNFEYTATQESYPYDTTCGLFFKEGNVNFIGTYQSQDDEFEEKLRPQENIVISQCLGENSCPSGFILVKIEERVVSNGNDATAYSTLSSCIKPSPYYGTPQPASTPTPTPPQPTQQQDVCQPRSDGYCVDNPTDCACDGSDAGGGTPPTQTPPPSGGGGGTSPDFKRGGSNQRLQ